MNISLSDHFTYTKLGRFVLPSVIMMVVTSLYSIVDGLFVSNYVGKNAFAALNLIFPIIMVVMAFGFMIGAGGSALVAKKFGEGEDDMANKYFSMFFVFAVILGVTLSTVCFIFMPQLAKLIGASDLILEDCVIYGRVLMVSSTFYILQNCFQNFMIVAEKPKLGLVITLLAGGTNIVLDYVLIYIFDMGIFGAAVATGGSQVIGAVIPLIYFSKKRKNTRLHFVKPIFDFKAIAKGCTNGVSELLSNISMSFVSMLYNIQLIKIAAENGIAAYGVIMYLGFTFSSIFFGYVIGTAPIISYHYGANNYDELKNLFRKSIVINICVAIMMTTISITFATPLSRIFVGYDAELLEMTVNGMRLYAISFLICGINIFASGFFTALNDGLVSGVISILRTLVFQVLSISVLPIFFGLNGIWLSLVTAELLSLIVSLIYFIRKRKVYKYI